MKRFLLSVLAAIPLSVNGADSCYEETFFDDFLGSELSDVWSYQVGDGCEYGICGWGNNEQQFYTRDNTGVSNGLLTITAKRDKTNNQITSSKIVTQDKFFQQYGRFEARIKVPDGLGIWPAFWIMPNQHELSWPLAGEIDILERPGRNKEDLRTVINAAHFGELWPQNTHFANFLIMPSPWHKDFHIYRVDWSPERIEWWVDEKHAATLTRNEVEGYRWPFDNHPYYVILNVAVGGTLGGDVHVDAFPAKMLVDFVRVSRQVSCSER